jgi:hypothetical protein
MKLNKPTYLPGEALEDGTLYVGVMNDGNRVYHLSIETKDEPKEMTWDEAKKFKGLPSIQEMNLMFANASALGLDKNEKCYWSATEFNNNYAYYERFSDGYQYNLIKINTFLVRCARRYLITQSFEHLKPEIEELKKRINELEEMVK